MSRICKKNFVGERRPARGVWRSPFLWKILEVLDYDLNAGQGRFRRCGEGYALFLSARGHHGDQDCGCGHCGGESPAGRGPEEVYGAAGRAGRQGQGGGRRRVRHSLRDPQHVCGGRGLCGEYHDRAGGRAVQYRVRRPGGGQAVLVHVRQHGRRLYAGPGGGRAGCDPPSPEQPDGRCGRRHRL